MVSDSSESTGVSEKVRHESGRWKKGGRAPGDFR